MTDEQIEHMQGIGDDFRFLLNRKYSAGQKEHGGNLWDKEGIIDMALDEAVDEIVYLLTLKKQIVDSGIQLGRTIEA